MWMCVDVCGCVWVYVWMCVGVCVDVCGCVYVCLGSIDACKLCVSELRQFFNIFVLEHHQ